MAVSLTKEMRDGGGDGYGLFTAFLAPLEKTMDPTEPTHSNGDGKNAVSSSTAAIGDGDNTVSSSAAAIGDVDGQTSVAANILAAFRIPKRKIH